MSASLPAYTSTDNAREYPHMTSALSLPGADGRSNLPPFNAIAKEILRQLDQQIEASPPACPGLEDHEILGPERLADIRTRFLLWTGNLGVRRKPEDPRALDRRLIDAPDVANRVREILKDLQDLLSQSGKSCDCDATNDSAAQNVHSMDEEDAMMMQLLGLQTSKSCTASWLSASLDDTLRRLFHLSALISKSSTRDRFARAGLKCRLEMYEAYDVQHIKEKVAHAGGRADVALVKRLGNANTSRRQFIAYSRKHAAELNQTAQGENYLLDQGPIQHGQIDASDKSPYGQSVGPSEKTKITDAQTKASTMGPINPDEFDYGLDDARSCTTVATSIVDGKAFSGLKVPELTQYAKPGVHFICPLCRTYQRFNGQTAWRRHVFSDIRAYVCTSPQCGMLMFGSFSTWRSHEMDHRREWFCPLCNILHHDESKARMHLKHHHGELAEQHEVETLLQTSSRPSEHLPADDCPFCDWGAALREQNRTPKEHDLTVPSRRFMKHIGRHLEEIALFVIPQAEEEQRSSGDTASNAVHAVLDEESATASTLSSFRSQPPIGAPVLFEYNEEPPSDEARPGSCPFPTCGRHVKDLKAHMLTHQNTRPEKCPVPSCEYHTKGFARKYDKDRHLLTHYKGKLVCDFCPGSGSEAEKSFNRADVFKRHLTSVHGVEQTPPSVRGHYKHLSHNVVDEVAGTCAICSVLFPDAQKFYEHVDDCLIRVIQEADPPDAHLKLSDTGVRRTEFSPRESGYFILGRVFDVFWTEQLAQDTWVTREALSRHVREQRYPQVRRFVVVKEETHRHHCTALPISTYDGQGVAKPGVIKSEHVVIFTGQDAPSPSENELPGPGETPIRPIPIRVVLDDASEMDQMSRVDLGGIHMFHHQVETRSVGLVHEDSMRDLIQQFYDVFNAPKTAKPSSHKADLANDLVEEEEDDDEIEDTQVIEVSESESGSESGIHDDDSADGDSREYDSGREIQRDYIESEIPNNDSDSESQEDEIESLRDVQDYEDESEIPDDEDDSDFQDTDNEIEF